MVIDEKLNSFTDALNEIEDGDSENGQDENPNRNGWIFCGKKTLAFVPSEESAAYEPIYKLHPVQRTDCTE